MLNKDIISDDMLDAVNGGFEKYYKDDAQANGKCPHCESFLKKNGVYYRCIDCGLLFDKYGNEIGRDD